MQMHVEFYGGPCKRASNLQQWTWQIDIVNRWAAPLPKVRLNNFTSGDFLFWESDCKLASDGDEKTKWLDLVNKERPLHRFPMGTRKNFSNLNWMAIDKGSPKIKKTIFVLLLFSGDMTWHANDRLDGVSRVRWLTFLVSFISIEIAVSICCVIWLRRMGETPWIAVLLLLAEMRKSKSLFSSKHFPIGQMIKNNEGSEWEMGGCSENLIIWFPVKSFHFCVVNFVKKESGNCTEHQAHTA